MGLRTRARGQSARKRHDIPTVLRLHFSKLPLVLYMVFTSMRHRSKNTNRINVAKVHPVMHALYLKTLKLGTAATGGRFYPTQHTGVRVGAVRQDFAVCGLEGAVFVRSSVRCLCFDNGSLRILSVCSSKVREKELTKLFFVSHLFVTSQLVKISGNLICNRQSSYCGPETKRSPWRVALR